MPIDLNAIRARAEEATKGPWTVIRDPEKPTRVLGIEYGVAHNHAPEAPCKDDDEVDDCPASPYKDRDIVKTDSGCYPPKLGDAEFIASAREDVPALLALVDTLQAQVRIATEELENIGLLYLDRATNEVRCQQCDAPTDVDNCGDDQGCKGGRARDALKDMKDPAKFFARRQQVKDAIDAAVKGRSR